ncbi:hypothetical protein LTR10_001263 [Elasticomyces elasticus]|nr:hypothetical protein LTR10_001263 [Elasticomyces elasticus]KAK4965370.1 hypothetical protein LTR42_012126 [Elasticomyces elasticus]
MPTLQTIPVEILGLICEHLGGRELRRGKGAGRLMLFKAWYLEARPVFLSGVDVASIRLYGHNLHELSDGNLSSSISRHLMRQNTRHLRLRMVGHWWDEMLSREYEEACDEVEENTEGSDFDMPGYLAHEQNELHPSAKNLLDNYPKWEDWRDDYLAPTLDDLFGDLRNFTALESLRFEASNEDPSYGDMLLRGKGYIHARTMRNILTNLPILHDLTNFTLDTAGTNIICPEPRNSMFTDQHTCFCTSVAAFLPRIHTVRLRMRRICPKVFPSIESAPQLRPEEVKAKNLIIKLHLPIYSPDPQLKMCALDGLDSNADRAPDSSLSPMLKGAKRYVQWLAHVRMGMLLQHPNPSTMPQHASGMDTLRISLPGDGGIVLTAIDCLTGQRLYPPEDLLVYEDDGMPCWFETRPDLCVSSDIERN